jgi:hypothetical protein
VTPDPPELERLAALGHVDPPPPGVLDAAREILWSAVAQEMLAAPPGHAAAPGQAAAPGHAAAPGQAAERHADRPRPADPDA